MTIFGKTEYMSRLVTIKVFTFTHEAAILRSRLEYEGIYYFIPDELLLQVHPFYSNALGGVKLQVREEDVEDAIAIMKDAGCYDEADLEPPKVQVWLYNLLSRLPLFKRIYA